ncbi:hypothetical protein GCK72_009131 [Caenorhabditis remanei]|uniref:Uncharacterized protein n=1 Tax=Caenorhabditis remanei TaxID=31234 RepID=A0A6A5GZC7_CAERE|nr:hypothetical protein GCK72_009131 [Caenorhabditis remanei]KAF1760880.1 hypothetical protein GCK72_009131 [Caenorhabditis remanei]
MSYSDIHLSSVLSRCPLNFLVLCVSVHPSVYPDVPYKPWHPNPYQPTLPTLFFSSKTAKPTKVANDRHFHISVSSPYPLGSAPSSYLNSSQKMLNHRDIGSHIGDLSLTQMRSQSDALLMNEVNDSIESGDESFIDFQKWNDAVWRDEIDILLIESTEAIPWSSLTMAIDALLDDTPSSNTNCYFSALLIRSATGSPGVISKDWRGDDQKAEDEESQNIHLE